MKTAILIFITAFAAMAAFIPNSTAKLTTASDTSLSISIARGGPPQTQFAVTVWGPASGVVMTIGNTGCTASRSVAVTRIYQSVRLRNGGPYYFGRIPSAGDTLSLCAAFITSDTTKKDSVQFITGTGAP